jgi:two-component system phosphate regulon response regulator PhoB
MTKILIVEDEPGLVTLLQYNLERQEYETCTCFDGAKAMETLEKERPDLILLDWMLPNVSGVDLCRLIRRHVRFKDTPVIMLTARGDESDKVKGFSYGADDYMTKPFSIPELLARIQALLRRTKQSTKTRILKAGILKLNLSSQQAFKNNQLIELGPTEFRLLNVLMEKAGHVFSREDLLQMVWGGDIHVQSRTVDVHIRRLRKALSDDGDLIRTIRSSGYAVNIDKI